MGTIRLIVIALSIISVLQCTGSAKTFADFNGNNLVDLGDAVNLAYMVLGRDKPDMNADLNRNGRVDIGDLARFVYYITGKTHSLTSDLELEYGVRYPVYVEYVVDGDTIDVILPNGTEERIRLLGIDCPETTPERNKLYEYDGITDLDCLAYWGDKG